MLKRYWVTSTAVMLAFTLVIAMTWITRAGLRLQAESEQAAAKSQFNQSMRLALWRLDSAIAPVIGAETAKPISLVSQLADGQVPHDGSNYVVGYFEATEAFNEVNSSQPLSKSTDVESVFHIVRSSLTESQLSDFTQRTSFTDLMDSIAKMQSRETLSGERTATASLAVQDVNTNPLAAYNTVPLNVAEAQQESLPESNPNYRGDLARRSRLYTGNVSIQAYGQQQVANALNNDARMQIATLEGPPAFYPLWVDDQLVLCRSLEDQSIQCGLIDWQRLSQDAQAAVADLLIEPKLTPLKVDASDNAISEYALASLPFELRASLPTVVSRWSTIHWAIIGGWGALIFAMLIGGFLLHSLWRLSEQRASFVSAVTHELRTPLTTFRMYSELLAGGMVDEGKQGHYLQTLCHQADRLTHLIDNVLTFARLERRAIQRSMIDVTVEELLHAVLQSLKQRVSDSEFELSWHIDQDVRSRKIRTDLAAVEQILCNLVDNAIKYAASADRKTIEVHVSLNRNVCIDVIDHGPGISSDVAKRLFRPFSRSAEQAAGSAPGVGLGLSLARRIAIDLGGSMKLMPTVSGCKMRLELP
jgi:signal transduction histidine kinase